MFDIARQCEAATRHNATAMSECIVAESEARTEILQGWPKLADAAAERCVKLGRRAKRLPYVAIAKCLGTDAAVAPRPTGQPAEERPTAASPPETRKP